MIVNILFLTLRFMTLRRQNAAARQLIRRTRVVHVKWLAAKERRV